jgi:hypothetical protein
VPDRQEREARAEPLEARIERLRAATEGLAPPATFVGRALAAAMKRREPGLAEVIALSARRAIVISAVAAAAAAVLGVHMEQALDGIEAEQALWQLDDEGGLWP